MREYLSPNEAAAVFPDSAKRFRELYASGKVQGFLRAGLKRGRLLLRAESIREYYRGLEEESREREQAVVVERAMTRRERYANHPAILAVRAAKAAKAAGASGAV